MKIRAALRILASLATLAALWYLLLVPASPAPSRNGISTAPLPVEKDLFTPFRK